MNLIVQVGIDDTDSKKGMCTTYVCAVAIGRLEATNVKILGCPKLIRLNPNWKLKTRGNCAVAFTAELEKRQVPAFKEIILRTVRELAELQAEDTNPGVVFYYGEKIPLELKSFSKKVIQDIVTIEEAESVARLVGAEMYKFKLGRGVIGALAAIGNTLDWDRTFELIAYRTPENRGSPRRIDVNSVIEMNKKTFPRTFDNLDPTTGEIRITPHTPCPILYGIRGETAEMVIKAHRLVKALEPIERVVVYQTNQGTDEHLRNVKISEAKPFWSVVVNGVVSQKPKVIRGGHVIFRIRDSTGEIDCAAYEPTRQFREAMKKLLPGDEVQVYGGIKEKPGLPLTINLEKLRVLKLASYFRKENPRCPSCGKRMKSEGRGKGYSCKKCKTSSPPNSARLIRVKRDLNLEMYEVPPRARRHLAKPLTRVKFSTREF